MALVSCGEDKVAAAPAKPAPVAAAPAKPVSVHERPSPPKLIDRLRLEEAVAALLHSTANCASELVAGEAQEAYMEGEGERSLPPTAKFVPLHQQGITPTFQHFVELLVRCPWLRPSLQRICALARMQGMAADHPKVRGLAACATIAYYKLLDGPRTVQCKEAAAIVAKLEQVRLSWCLPVPQLGKWQ